MNTVDKILVGLEIRSQQLKQSIELAQKLKGQDYGFELTLSDLEGRLDENDCLIDVIKKSIKENK